VLHLTPFQAINSTKRTNTLKNYETRAKQAPPNHENLGFQLTQTPLALVQIRLPELQTN
jgi:hypothetical protein